LPIKLFWGYFGLQKNSAPAKPGRLQLGLVGLTGIIGTNVACNCQWGHALLPCRDRLPQWGRG
jgi:hypothetical protein